MPERKEEKLNTTRPPEFITLPLHFERAFHHYLTVRLGFSRELVWRGALPSEPSWQFCTSYQTAYPYKGIIQADSYQKMDWPSIPRLENRAWFFYLYQMPQSTGLETIMTYLVSSNEEVINEKASQIARYGSYTPRVQRLINWQAPLLPPPEYAQYFESVTIADCAQSLAALKISRLGEMPLFSTQRLATFMYQETFLLEEPFDPRKIGLKLFTHRFSPKYYVAKLLPLQEETGGIPSLNFRPCETNCHWYAQNHLRNFGMRMGTPLLPGSW